MKWRTLKVGQEITYTVNDFDGHGEFKAVVIDVSNERAIAECNGMKLWIEDFNADMFKA